MYASTSPARASRQAAAILRFERKHPQPPAATAGAVGGRPARGAAASRSSSTSHQQHQRRGRSVSAAGEAAEALGATGSAVALVGTMMPQHPMASAASVSYTSASGSSSYAHIREATLRTAAASVMGALIAAADTTYYARRSAAALCIQCAWRSSRARLEAFSRRQIFWHFLHIRQKAAAACIVSFFKMVLLQKHRRTVCTRNAQRVAERIELERRQRAAAIRITNAMRRHVAARRETERLMRLFRLQQEGKLVLYRVAAVIVQRWWRIIAPEKAYWRRRAAEIEAERAARREEQRIDGAATRIQKIFRGALGRKFVANRREAAERDRIAALRRIKESIDVVRVFLRSVAARVKREAATGERLIVSEDGATVTAVPISLPPAESSLSSLSSTSAAVAMHMSGQLVDRIREQRDERAAAERRAMDAAAAQQMVREAQRLVYQRAMATARACGTIQRAWRCFRARRELRVARAISKAHDQIRFDRELDQYKATCLVQRCGRALLSARLTDQITRCNSEAFWGALRTVQRVGAAFIARRALRKAQCQAIYEKNRAQFEAARRRQRTEAVLIAFVLGRQSLCRRAALEKIRDRDALALMAEVQAAMEADRAALRIQRMVRSSLARKGTQRRVAEMGAAKGRVLAAVVKIQSFVRAKVLAPRLFRQRRREYEFARRNKALEAALLDGELMGFMARFETIEANARALLEGEEAEGVGALRHQQQVLIAPSSAPSPSLVSRALKAPTDSSTDGDGDGGDGDDDSLYGNDPYDA